MATSGINVRASKSMIDGQMTEFCSCCNLSKLCNHWTESSIDPKEEEEKEMFYITFKS